MTEVLNPLQATSAAEHPSMPSTILPDGELHAIGAWAIAEPIGVNEHASKIYAIHDFTKPGRVLLGRIGQNQLTRDHAEQRDAYLGPRPHKA